MNHIEIELRYEVLNSQQLPSFLCMFEKLHRKHDIDVYFDNPHVTLFQRGIFLRIRNDKKLEIKFNRACLEDPTLAIQDYCEEHSFSLPLLEKDLARLQELLVSLELVGEGVVDIATLKSINQLDIFYIIDKERTSYQGGSFEIAVDEVADLGTFLEIELMASSIENLASIKQEMQNLLKGLSLEPLKTGYGTLLLRKKNFQQYLLGRFILESDKALKDVALNNS